MPPAFAAQSIGVVSCNLLRRFTFGELGSGSTATRVARRAKNQIPAGGKNDGVRRVQICVRELAVNSGDCAIPKSAALLLWRVTEVVKFAGGFDFSEGTSAKWIFNVEIEN
jgi:hypothetical protein